MKTMAIAAAGVLTAALSSPAVERQVPFRVGETLTYDVSWSSYLTAGTAVATIEDKQPVGGSLAYHIVAEGRPVSLVSKLYALDYRMDALLDSSTLLPHRASVYIEEGSRKRTRPTEFDRRISPAAVDPLSALYALRASPLKAGGRVSMPIVDNGVTYTVRFAVGDAETVAWQERSRGAQQGGGSSAWKISVAATDQTGRPAGRNMAIWISTDPRRLPVKLQAELPIGEFNLMLRDAK